MTLATHTAVPAQRRNPNDPWPGQTKHAAQLMRQLWGHDPETCEELVQGLYAMNRVQLGRVIDNLMHTLSIQPRMLSADQAAHIRALWPRKMSKPIDAKVERKFAEMTEADGQRLVYKLQAMPDRCA